MKGLAEIVLDHLCIFMFDEENIDSNFASRHIEIFPDYLTHLSEEERKALSTAAEALLNRLMAEPDEYGYSARKLVTEEEKSFLEVLANGELYKQWCQ